MTGKIFHKFHAKRTESDGISFASKKEARYYEQLKLLQKTGEVLFFLRQVGIDLPGGCRYRVDFIVFYSDHSVVFVDVKGMRTKDYILKKKQVEALYPIQITEI